MTTSKPTIIFCHGAWHYPEFFNKVIAILEPLGYKCIALQLPGAGNEPPVKSLDDDFAVVRSAVVKELDAGNNVMMHAHSLGGIVVGGALDGLGMAERKAQDKATGVVKLSFVSAFVLPEEMTVLDALGGTPDPGAIIREVGAHHNSLILAPLIRFRMEQLGGKISRICCIMMSPKAKRKN